MNDDAVRCGRGWCKYTSGNSYCAQIVSHLIRIFFGRGRRGVFLGFTPFLPILEVFAKSNCCSRYCM